MLDLETIVFPTDFSPCSNQAFDFAVLLAEMEKAQLHLLHATVLFGSDVGDPSDRFPEAIELLDRLEKLSKSELGALATRDRLAALKVREAVRRGFKVSEVVLDYAREVDADAIVMGTHGRRGPRRWLIGSVTEEVLRASRVPVLVVREDSAEQAKDERLRAIDRILVPIDFSRNSARALETAVRLADALDAVVSLLHVVDLPAVPSFYGQALVTDLSQVENRSLDALNELAAEAGLAEDRYEAFVDTGWPSAAIVDHAARRDCGLIVLTAHSRHRSGLLGNTTDVVLRRATCPVLALPGAERGSDDED